MEAMVDLAQLVEVTSEETSAQLGAETSLEVMAVPAASSAAATSEPLATLTVEATEPS
ncbi:hypothetical protein B566_EDAN013610, partial [Ephemera danica]